jgi:Leucine Rich repeat
MKLETKGKRRWFQFSLRTLLIFTLICAIPCAWLGRKIERKRQEREAVEALIKLGGRVEYDDQPDHSAERNLLGVDPPGPRFLRTLVGENFFCEVEFVTLRNTHVTDAGLEYVKGLTHLQTLELDGTTVSDAGIENLKDLTRLKELDLRFTKVTDLGVKEIQKSLPNCKIYY